jgi:serine/threonine-protein kinase
VQTARELAERIERFLDGDRDLAMRRDLARAHLDRARAAFATSDSDENRRVAMREAAGALALDPALSGAAELVGRLMLEPPRETPREVKEAMHRDDMRDAKALALAGMWAVFGGLCFIPLLWWIAPAGSPYVPALMMLLLGLGGISYFVVRSANPKPGLVILANAVVVVMLSRMFSPILIAPGIAASLAMAMVLTPRFSLVGSPVTIACMFGGAVIGPLLLERMGVISETMTVNGAGVLFHPPGISGALDGPTNLVGALYAVGLVVGAVTASHYMRRRAVNAAHHLHLQAWQLRQLVPR